MADQNFKAEKIGRYRKVPVDPNLVLIDTGKKPFGSSTFVYRIIRECLVDTEPDLKVALITDSFEIYEHGLQEFLRDSRFLCVLPDTDTYYRYYCTAGKLYSAGWLPGFFSKREGQYIALFLPPDQYSAASGFSRPVFNRAVSLRMADEIIDTSPESYYRDTPEHAEKDTLLVYFTEKGPLYGKNLLNLIQFHKTAGGIAAAEQLKLIYVVPPSLWKTCRERRESLPFENMLPATDDFAPFLASAAAVLTVPGRFLDYAQARSIPCLVFTGRIQKDHSSYCCAHSWEGIESVFRAFITKVVNSYCESYVWQPPTHFQYPKTGIEKKNILLVTDWALFETYHPFFKIFAQNNSEKGCSVDILLRTLNKVSRKSVEALIPKDIDVFLFSDACSVAAKIREKTEIYEEEYYRKIAQEEWRRILGDSQYDVAIIQKTSSDLFWNTMYRYMPCFGIEFVTSKKLPPQLVPFFLPVILKRYMNNSSLMSEVYYQGKCFFQLGRTSNGFIYGEKSFNKDNFVLCLYQGGDLEYCFDIWRKKFTTSHLVILNNTGKGIQKRKDGQSFTEYQLSGLPISLLLCCRAFLCAQDNTEILLSTMLEIPADCPSGAPTQTLSAHDALKLTERDFWSGIIWDTSVPNLLEN